MNREIRDFVEGDFGLEESSLEKDAIYIDGADTDRGFETLLQEEMSAESVSNDASMDATKEKTKQCNLQDAATNEPTEDDGNLPCKVFFINDKSTLQPFKSYNELSEYLVNVATEEKRSPDEHADYISKIQKFPLKDVVHYTTMGEYFRNLYECDSFMDVRLDVDEKIFMAHRVALSCHSKYFAELLKTSRRNKIPFEVTLKGICAEAFASFLEFVYTGEMTIYPEIAADMLLIADFLKVKALQDKRDIIASYLPIERIVNIITKIKGSRLKLYGDPLTEVLNHFASASDLVGFLDIDIDTLCLLLSSDELVVQTEYTVFQVALRWIVHDADNRLLHTSKVMQLVRFSYMTQDELLTCAEATSLMRGYDKFREIVLFANWYKTCQDLKRDDPFHLPRPGPRNSYKKNDVPTSPPLMTSTPKQAPRESQLTDTSYPQNVDILVVAGFQAGDQQEANKYIERYDTKDNQWVHYCKLPEQRRHHAVAVLFGKLYLIGGSDPSSDASIPTPTCSVYQMDVVDKEWMRVADMQQARLSHCACPVNGHIFAVGGKGLFDSILATVECYDPQTDSWTYVQPLSSPRYAAAAASISNKIYVVGGLVDTEDGRQQALDTVECFESTLNIWQRKTSIRFPRCNASLVNVAERLYLCGGATQPSDQNTMLISVASIDEYIDQHDVWCHRTDMAMPRHDAGVAVAGNQLYIIGGVSSTGDRVLQSIECYDSSSATWLAGVQDLPFPARWICCASIASKWQPTLPECIQTKK